jgi:hypothetical protein
MFARAACHVHSDWSYDGKWSLEKLAASFAKRGCQVVLITEHDLGFSEERRQLHCEACRKASTEKILLVPGIEYGDPSNVVHLLVWGDVPFLGEKLDSDRVLAAVKEANGVVVMAHPSRKEAWKKFKPEWKHGLLGIELWNRKTDGWAPSRDSKPLLEMSGAVPFVGIDFHTARQFFPLRMMLEVEPPLTEASVLGALRRRRCSAKAFGLEVEILANGLGSTVLRPAEFLRRTAARTYRKLFS